MDDAKTLAAQARISVSEIGYRLGTKQSAIGFIDRLADLAVSHQAEVVRLTDDRDSWRDQASARTDDAVRFAAERDTWERRALKESEAHASNVSGYKDAVERLTAERDALRKDAARYQWLREADWIDVSIEDSRGIIGLSPSTLDAAIDAALADAQGAQT